VSTFWAVLAALCAYGLITESATVLGKLTAKWFIKRSPWLRRSVAESIEEDRQIKRSVGA
jgi:hypothetical protein